MDDLVGRLVANAGVDRTVAETTDGSVLRFPLEEESAEKLRRRVRNRPGAETAIPASTSVRGGPRVRDPIGGPASAGRRMMIAGPTLRRGDGEGRLSGRRPASTRASSDTRSGCPRPGRHNPEARRSKTVIAPGSIACGATSH